MAPTFGRIKGEESSTITFKARTVTVTQNSSGMQQELLTLADPESSLGVARVLGAPMASTEFGLGVRVISGPALTASSPTFATVNSTSAVVVSANAARTGLVLVNTGSAPVSLAFSTLAVQGSGITLNASGGTFQMDHTLFTLTAVSAVSSAATNLGIQEFV